MKVQTLKDYIAKAKLEKKHPMVLIAGVKFLLCPDERKDGDDSEYFNLFIGIEALDEFNDWESWSEPIAKKMRCVPLNNCPDE